MRLSGHGSTRPDAASYPRTRRKKPPRRGREVEVPRGRVGTLVQVATGMLKQVRPVDDLAKAHPQAAVPHMDAKWWLLSQFDSALVSTADGTGLAWYRRDPDQFADVLRRSLAVHRRLLAEWPRLARAYRDAAAEGSSPQRWERTFASAAPPR